MTEDQQLVRLVEAAEVEAHLLAVGWTLVEPFGIGLSKVVAPECFAPRRSDEGGEDA